MSNFKFLSGNKLVRRNFLFIFCILLSLNVFSQKKIVILGSSTSACNGPSSYDSCYVSRLKNYYQSRGTGVTIDNRAVSGYTVYQGMPSGYRPPSGRDNPDTTRNITAALAARPNVILVNFPSNGYYYFSITEVLSCFRIIKQAAAAAGVPCFITSTQPRQDVAYQTAEVKKRMVAIKDSILKEYGPFAINFFDSTVNPVDTTILPRYNSGDGVHLNNAGHRILFEQVKRADILRLNAPLSVNPINFSSSLNGNKVLLRFVLANANEFNSFGIEKSLDGRNFRELITESPVYTSQADTFIYNFTDAISTSLINYYRVKVKDKRGEITYSEVLEIKPVAENGIMTVFPNPVVGNSISITLNNLPPGNYSITFVDHLGRRVYSLFDNNVSINPNRVIHVNKFFPPGLYKILVQGDNGVTKVTTLFKAR